MSFTIEEKDRLCEILFLKYFENMPADQLESKDFWDLVNCVCRCYKVDNVMIVRAIRLLMAKENAPEDLELWYLLDKMEISVRNIKGFTGLYWQKQNACRLEFESGTKPHIHRRVTDVAMKRAIKDFVKAIYEVFGSFKFLNLSKLDNLFSA